MKALQLLDIAVSPDLHELTKHGTPLFPCAGYDEDPGKYWHAVIAVEDGVVVLKHYQRCVPSGA